MASFSHKDWYATVQSLNFSSASFLVEVWWRSGCHFNAQARYAILTSSRFKGPDELKPSVCLWDSWFGSVSLTPVEEYSYSSSSSSSSSSKRYLEPQDFLKLLEYLPERVPPSRVFDQEKPRDPPNAVFKKYSIWYPSSTSLKSKHPT